MIIFVDHGNKSIKTPNTLFTSGLIVSEGLQGFKTDYICWNNRYYTLTEQRIAYLRDKTEDDRFYVLTLFAIAKELERRKIPETLDPIDITLLVGLPPAHYEQLHSRFEQYFLRRCETIDFEYNGKYYSIRVNKVLSYPQAFAAAVTQYGILKTYSVAYIIDIGGFTIDVLKLRNGHPDLAVVESFEKGVITLYNNISSKCNALYARILEDCDIDEVIRNQPTVLPGEVQQMIRNMTGDFLSEFYNFLRERGIDLQANEKGNHKFSHKCSCLISPATRIFTSVTHFYDFHDSDVSLHLTHGEVELLDNSNTHLTCDAICIQIHTIP